MSKLITTSIVRALVCALAVLPLSREAHAVIYGKDNRQFKSDAPKEVQSFFERTFIMGPPVVSNEEEVNIAKRHFTSADTEKGTKSVCADEPGHGLPVPEWSCSGGMVGEDRIMTAGHCFEPTVGRTDGIGTQGMFFRDASLEKVKGKQLLLSKGNRHPIKRWEIVQQWMSKPKEGEPEAQDYAIATVEGKIAKEHIFPIAKESPRENEKMALIGHPAGLPSMYRDFRVFHRSDKYLMVQNSNTYHGDSGSLQFDEKGHVRAVFIQGMDDFYSDKQNGGCARSYVCPEIPVLVSMRNQEKRKGLSADERRCLYEKAQRIEEPEKDDRLVTALQSKDVATGRWMSAKVLPVKDLEKKDIELNVQGEGEIGKVVVVVRYQHTFAGDWAFKLSHGDRTVQLAKSNGEDNRRGYITSIFSSEDFQRLPVNGRYTLNVADEQERDAGKIYGVSVHVIKAIPGARDRKGNRQKTQSEKEIDDLLPGHYVPASDPDAVVPVPTRKAFNPWIVAPCEGDGAAHCAQPNLKIEELKPHLGYPVDAFDGNYKVYLALARGQQVSDLEVLLPSKITTATGEVVPVNFEDVQLLEPIPYAIAPGANAPDMFRMLVVYRYHGKKQVALADFDVQITSDGSSDYQFTIQNHDSMGRRKSRASGSMNVSTGHSTVTAVK